MKPSVSIALILCGTALVLAPFFFNLALTGITASVMAGTSRDVHFRTSLDDKMQWTAAIAGLLMVVLGIVGSFRSRPSC